MPSQKYGKNHRNVFQCPACYCNTCNSHLLAPLTNRVLTGVRKAIRQQSYLSLRDNKIMVIAVSRIIFPDWSFIQLFTHTKDSVTKPPLPPPLIFFIDHPN